MTASGVRDAMPHWTEKMYTPRDLDETTHRSAFEAWTIANDQLVERASQILELVNQLGLEPPPPPEPLPEINPEDVHLVCWLALVPEHERQES